MAIEIMFSDLKESKQRELLEAFGIDNPNDCNWGIVPIAIIETEEINST